MKRHFLSLVLLVLVSSSVQAQVQSVASGDWNTPSTWSCSCVPGVANGAVTISASNVVDFNGGTQTISSLVVDSDAILNINADTLIVNNSIDITIGDSFSTFDGYLNINLNGSLQGQGLVSSNSGNFQVNGTYIHNQNGGVIPDALWNAGSTLVVSGITNTKPSGLGQTFYNIIWNSTHTAVISLLGELTTIQNDFTVLNTGTTRALNLSTNTNATTNISGDLSIENSSLFGVVGSGNYTLNINGNLTVSSSSANAFLLTGTGTPIVNVTGNFIKSNSGSVNFASGAGGNGTLKITGNLELSSGSLTETNSGQGNIVFVGSGLHTFTKTGGSIVNTVNFTNESSSTLDLGSSILEGGGAFTNNGTLRVGSIHASGALQNTTILDADCGNIITPFASRSFGVGSVIVYNYTGGTGQIIGDGHPTTAGVDITVSNPNGVSIIAPTTLAGTINLSAGNLNINSSSLTITGNVTGTNKISIGSLGSLTLGGSSNIGTFPFTAGTQTFTNFTLDNTNGITFGENVVLTGQLSLNNGTLTFIDRSLTLNGTISSISGNLTGNSSSTLSIGGSGAFGTLPFLPASTLGTLTFNRGSSGTADINSSVTVSGTFNLTNGDFTNTNGLKMANGSTINRSSSAQLLGNRPTDLPAGEFYNVTYSGGAFTAGLELPGTSSDMLGTVTVNGGPVTLNKDIIIRGDLNLQSSTLQASTFNITMAGTSNIWSKTNGSFDGGSGQVIISGNVTVSASSTPSFSNLTTNSGSVLTMYSGITNISGNLQLNSAGTYNANGGTISLNGSVDQAISAAGKTFVSIAVNKSAGNVDIATALNLTNVLDVQSSTTVFSNGNLTLVSNASGTASITKLAGSVSGDVNVQRYIANAGRKYRDISSPVQNPPVSDITNSGITITGPFTGSSYPCAGCSTNNPSFYYYDESVAGAQSQGYLGYPASGSNSSTTYLSPGRGYNLLVRDELGSPVMNLTGNINSGTIALPVTYTTTTGGSSEDGWNFIGNPYPCAIDWDILAGWTKGNVQGNQIAIYDPTKGTSGGYRIWNGSVGDLSSGQIASGQGFWVKFLGTPTLTLDEDAKITSGASFYRQKKTVPNYIEVILTGADSEDRAYIHQIEGASLRFDPQDGPKLVFSEGLNLSVLTEDHFQVAVQATGYIISSGTIPMSVNGIVSGDYKFSKNLFGDYEEIPVLLFDSHANVYHDLTTDYSFQITENDISSSNNRFYLVIGRPSIITATEEEASSSIFSIYPNPVAEVLQVKVRAQDIPGGEVFDSMGKLIGKIEWMKESSQIWKGSFAMDQQPSGIYFTKVIIKNSMKVIKFTRR